MGLGKTVQAIGVIAHLAEAQLLRGPVLVVAPLSTLSGWAEQLEEFCPALRVVRYNGSASERAALRRSALARTDEDTVLLASYEPVLADGAELST